MKCISEFGWYDWVMFGDNVPTFPDNELILGRYLVGPMADVGLALTTKILNANGQFVCHSTLRHLNDDELNCLTHAETLMSVFMNPLNRLQQKLTTQPKT